MTKQEAMAAIERQVVEAESDIARIREEIAGSMRTAMGERSAVKEIAYQRGLIAGMCAAHFFVQQITEDAECVPVVEAVR